MGEILLNDYLKTAICVPIATFIATGLFPSNKYVFGWVFKEDVDIIIIELYEVEVNGNKMVMLVIARLHPRKLPVALRSYKGK